MYLLLVGDSGKACCFNLSPLSSHFLSRPELSAQHNCVVIIPEHVFALSNQLCVVSQLCLGAHNLKLGRGRLHQLCRAPSAGIVLRPHRLPRAPLAGSFSL